MELKKYKLGEIGKIVTGKTPSTTKKANYSDATIPFYTPEDVAKGFTMMNNNKRFISSIGFNEIKNNTLDGESVLVGCIGSDMGNVAYSNIKCATNQQINSITQFKKDIEPLYVYYLLSTKKEYFRQLAGSTTTPLLPKSVFENIEIYLPEKLVQNKIASTLSNLDQKIALNRQINDNLEAMAKQLYDYWFVQFDFPNEEGKPYKSSGGKMVYNPKLKRQIPDGWECTSLGKIIQELESGKRPKGGIDKTLKEGIPSLGAEAISKLGDFDYAKTPYVPYDTKINSGVIRNNDILVYKDGAYVGKTTLYRDNFPYEYATINEHVFLLRTIDPKMQEYIFFTLQKDYLFDVMQNLGKAKAAQPGLNQDDLKGIEILQPNKEYIYKYKKTIEPLLAKLFNNAKEIASLTQQRDELLPLLMNGQVSVD